MHFSLSLVSLALQDMVADGLVIAFCEFPFGGVRPTKVQIPYLYPLPNIVNPKYSTIVIKSPTLSSCSLA